MEERLWTTEQAAEYLQIRVETVRDLLRRGLLKGSKISAKDWRLRKTDIDEFLRERSNIKEQ